MAAEAGLRNPYIAGRALGQQRGFFGREDILRLVETELALPDQNALVLFGQRRIGKTSILLQLQRRLASRSFLPVYFDLMDRARQPLGQLLFEIASTIAPEIGIAIAKADLFDSQGLYFSQEFLPVLYKALGESRRPVLLFDEFDVLDVAAEEQLPSLAAARTFFPYLRRLMRGETRLGFIFVVGRRAEDLSIDVKATFKGAHYKRVSVLDAPSARELITISERQGTLIFEASAIDRIQALTAGHPYFIQLLCQIVWNSAHATNSSTVPVIDVTAVEVAAAKSLEAGQNIFEWIWDGLPPAERVICAAIAEATYEHSLVTEDQLVRLLQSRGARILTREIELAPHTLVEWEMLCQIDGGYQFFIELMRRWVATYKPLLKVKDELDRIVPLADTLYRAAAFYQHSDPDSAQDQLRKALRANPNHLKARLLLAELLLQQGALEEAVRELEEAYSYDEEASHYPFVRTLLTQGEEFERLGNDDDALAVYERVLDLSPHETVARERHAAILVKAQRELTRRPVWLVSVTRLLAAPRIWVFGRLMVVILLILGFFGPWTQITSCGSQARPLTGLNAYTLSLSLSVAAMLVLILIALAAVLAITLLRIIQPRLRRSSIVNQLAGIASGVALVGGGLMLLVTRPSLEKIADGSIRLSLGSSFPFEGVITSLSFQIILFLVPVAVGSLFAVTTLRLALRHLRFNREIIWIERVASGTAVIGMGGMWVLLSSGSPILWGFWSTFAGALLSSLNLIGEYLSKRLVRRQRIINLLTSGQQRLKG